MSVTHHAFEFYAEVMGLQDVALFTTSHAPDFELCKTLCKSIDALMPRIRHYLAVTRVDRALFTPLLRPGRELIVLEHALPEFIRFRRPNGRNMWITPYRVKPVAPWYFQQIAKMAVVSTLPERAILMVDSDVEFIRPVRPSDLLRDGRARLVQGLFDRIEPHDTRWAQTGARLLGAPEAAEPHINYVENLIVWRPEIVAAMLSRIAQVTGLSWKRAILREKGVSEYCFYGQFVDHVPGAHQDSVFRSPDLLCHTLHYDFDRPGMPSETDFIATLASNHIAFGIQSNISMEPARRARLAIRLRAAAARLPA